MRMRAAGAVLVLALAAPLAACGGDDGDDGDDKLSKAEYIEQADEACVDSALRPRAIPQNMAQAAEQTAQATKARKDLQVELEKLTPPDELKGDVDRFLANSNELIAVLQKMNQVARANRPAEFAKEEATFGEISDERGELADRIGFKKCGQPFTPEEQREFEK